MLDFRRIGLQNQMNAARLRQAQGQLGRSAQRLDMRRQALADEKRALPLTTAIGIGTAIHSGLEGRRRKALLEEDAQFKRDQRTVWKKKGLI
jgi:hypothetical protein